LKIWSFIVYLWENFHKNGLWNWSFWTIKNLSFCIDQTCEGCPWTELIKLWRSCHFLELKIVSKKFLFVNKILKKILLGEFFFSSWQGIIVRRSKMRLSENSEEKKNVFKTPLEVNWGELSQEWLISWLKGCF